MRYLYTILLYFATPFLIARLFWRSLKNPAYRARWQERLGFIPTINQSQSLWVHAVSLGESIAAVPLIQSLIEQYPTYRIVVTTTTPTGSLAIQKQFADKVHHVYAPFDLPWVIRRFLRRLQPAKVIIMETELWPNLLYHLHRTKIPVIIANARLSERSFLKYQRVKQFFAPLLRSIQVVAAQSEADADRFQKLGIPHHCITITGNIKFDRTIPNSLFEAAKTLRQHWSMRPVFIAASTHQGEESQILTAFQQILKKIPNTLMILAPRHPERFNTVAALCEAQGYLIARRSKKEWPTPQSQIYLADTTGELMLLYAASDVAFVGGSLVPIGGHNLIEPASLSLPIISGFHLENFVAVRDLLCDHQALLLTDNADELAKTVIELLSDADLRHNYGARALSVIEKNRGAIAKHLMLIKNSYVTRA